MNITDCVVFIFLIFVLKRMAELVIMGDIAHAIFIYLFLGLAFYIGILLSLKRDAKNISMNPIKVITLWIFMLFSKSIREFCRKK